MAASLRPPPISFKPNALLCPIAWHPTPLPIASRAFCLDGHVGHVRHVRPRLALRKVIE